MKYLKYFFTPTQKASAFAKITVPLTANGEGDEEGNTSWDSSKVVAVADLGQPVVTPATYDEEGNVLTEAVLSSKHEVDIIWVDEPLTTSFASYVVWPTPGGYTHTFSGWEQAYAEEYCKANPEAAYCQPPAPIDHEA